MVDVGKREDLLLDTISELIRKRNATIEYAEQQVWCDDDRDEIALMIERLR